MMPRPKSSNLNEVLNKQALIGKSSDWNLSSQVFHATQLDGHILSQKWEDLKCFSQPQFSTDHAHLFTSVTHPASFSITTHPTKNFSPTSGQPRATKFGIRVELNPLINI